MKTLRSSKRLELTRCPIFDDSGEVRNRRFEGQGIFVRIITEFGSFRYRWIVLDHFVSTIVSKRTYGIDLRLSDDIGKGGLCFQVGRIGILGCRRYFRGHRMNRCFLRNNFVGLLFL